MWLWLKYRMWVAAVLGGLVVIAAGLLVGLALVESRRAAIKDAEIAAEKLALVVEQSMARTFESYALSIAGTVHVLESGDADGLPLKVRRLVLFDSAAHAGGVGAVLVLDTEGRIVFDSRSEVSRAGSFSDRDYFAAQKVGDAGLYISAPFISRLDQEWSVALSRRVNHPNGSFAGIVVGTIKLAGFRKLFDSLAKGKTGSTISLFRTDGTALVRSPHVDAEVGRNYSNVGLFEQLKIADHGTFDQVAVRDGVARRYVYGKVGQLPLVFSIGLASDEILSEWTRKVQVLGGLAVAILGMMASLAFMLRRELARRQNAERVAVAAAARFEQLAIQSNDAIVLRNVDGKRIYASPRFYELLDRAPDAVGETGLQTYLHPNDRALPLMTICRLLQGEKQVSETLQCLRPDGSSIWLESVSRLLARPDGLSSEILTNIRDVTRHKLHTDAVEFRKQELEVLANVDGLTGIANRRAFDTAYKDELARTAASGLPLSILMVDVDHFKKFNDQLGHAAGDAALKAVATCIAGVARRPPDVAARYGGEEFVLLLPSTEMSGARRIAERLRAAIADMNVAHPEGGRLTVSVGVATCLPTHEAIDLVSAADQALYAAKAAGRDRVRSFGPHTAAA